MKKFKSIREAKKLKISEYKPSFAQQKPKGFRAKVEHEKTGATGYLGTAVYKTKQLAIDCADAYIMGYTLGGEKSALKMVDAHIKNNKKGVLEGVSEAKTTKS